MSSPYLFFCHNWIFLHTGVGVGVDGDAEQDDIVLPALVDLVEAVLRKQNRALMISVQGDTTGLGQGLG